MPARESAPLGAPCRIDLQWCDVERAAAFSDALRRIAMTGDPNGARFMVSGPVAA